MGGHEDAGGPSASDEELLETIGTAFSRLRRRTAYGPIANRSTGEEPKHSNASRGSSTMGRPAVFRLVLTTTGSPVSSSKVPSTRATSGS